MIKKMKKFGEYACKIFACVTLFVAVLFTLLFSSTANGVVKLGASAASATAVTENTSVRDVPENGKVVPDTYYFELYGSVTVATVFGVPCFYYMECSSFHPNQNYTIRFANSGDIVPMRVVLQTPAGEQIVSSWSDIVTFTFTPAISSYLICLQYQDTAVGDRFDADIIFGMVTGLETSSAFWRGFAAAYTSGFEYGDSVGYERGYSVGYSEGYTTGYNEAYDKGYQDGVEYGRREGWQDGYEQGKDEGYDEGYQDAIVDQLLPVAHFTQQNVEPRFNAQYLASYTASERVISWTSKSHGPDADGAFGVVCRPIMPLLPNSTYLIRYTSNRSFFLGFKDVAQTYLDIIPNPSYFEAGEEKEVYFTMPVAIHSDSTYAVSGANSIYLYIESPDSSITISNVSIYQVSDSSGVYDEGYKSGLAQGKIEGRIEGYQEGYSKGLEVAESGNFFTLIMAVIDAPVSAFTSLLDFNILGFNMRSVMLSFLMTAFVIAVVRLFTEGKT